MAISGKRIILANNQALRAKDQNGDVQELLKLDAAGQIAGKVKEYIDSQNTIDQGEITTLQSDVATLNGDSSTAGSVDFKVAAEAALRASGDTATLDAAKAYADSIQPVVAVEQVKHVAKNGNDSIADGSLGKPFATITAAMNSISDASPSKRYVIRVAPGSYTEASLALRANMFIVGDTQDSVRITGPVSLHSSFSGSADNRSGFSRVMLLSAVDLDWSTVTSAAGKIYIMETAFGSTVRLYGHNNAIAQAQIQSCEFYGVLTVSGINVGLASDNRHFAGINLQQHPNGGMATILSMHGGAVQGKITMTTAVNDFNRRCSLFAFNTMIDELAVDGPSSYADLTESSVPRFKDRLTSSNGGNVVYITSNVPHKTNERNFGEPGRQYLYNFAYVHASTDSDVYLISMGTDYAAASTGRSVNIESDSYGLNSDVNGGDIKLTTATTSGTGVRGKIKLDAKEVDVSSVKIVNLADGVDSQDAVSKAQLDSGLADKASQADLDAVELRVDGAESDIDQLQLDMATKASQADLDLAESDIDQLQLDVAAKLNSSLKGAPNGVAELDATGKVPVAQLPVIQSIVAVKMAAVTLSSQQIADGYLDLTHAALASSISVFCERVAILEGLDYTVSSVGGVSRLTWIGPSAAGAEEEFAEGDVVYIQYLRNADPVGGGALAPSFLAGTAYPNIILSYDGQTFSKNVDVEGTFSLIEGDGVLLSSLSDETVIRYTRWRSPVDGLVPGDFLLSDINNVPNGIGTITTTMGEWRNFQSFAISNLNVKIGGTFYDGGIIQEGFEIVS